MDHAKNTDVGVALMTEKEKELLLSWIVNEQLRLDQELIELRNRIRFRHIDISDNIEMMLLQQRITDFEDFARVLIRLLRLDIRL